MITQKNIGTIQAAARATIKMSADKSMARSAKIHPVRKCDAVQGERPFPSE